MSRIGKMPVTIPAEVTAQLSDNTVIVKGSKGSLSVSIPKTFQVDLRDQSIFIKPKSDFPEIKSHHGMLRSIINNAVIGVSNGWKKTLELVGVGFRVQGNESEITLYIGFTHPVKISAPPNVAFTISDNTKITVSGIDKKVVGEVAASIRAIRPPEPYKGKGIRYLGEIVRKKAGKAVKTIGTAI